MAEASGPFPSWALTEADRLVDLARARAESAQRSLEDAERFRADVLARAERPTT